MAPHKLWTTVAAALFAVACSGEKTDDAKLPGDGGLPPVLDGGGKIPDPPDGESACAKGACNYQKQDCASGQSCLPSPGGGFAPTCQAAGSMGVGQSCSGWSECAPGLFCAGVGVATDGGIAPGTCRRLCCGGDWSACEAGESCYQQLYLLPAGAPAGAEPVYAGADLCGPIGNCDVFDSASCEGGRTCQIVDPRGSVACLPEGSAEIGQPCSSLKRCKSGALCKGGKCRRLCRAVPGGTPTCPPDEGSCVHFATDPEGVGECTQVVE